MCAILTWGQVLKMGDWVENSMWVSEVNLSLPKQYYGVNVSRKKLICFLAPTGAFHLHKTWQISAN